MKNLLTRNQLAAILSSICWLIPMAYAESDVSDLVLIEQVGNVYPNIRNIKATTSSTVTNDFNDNNEVLVTQLGDNNYAAVDVTGNNNQLSLTQEGNKNKGEIQVNGNSNNLSTLQNGDGLSFGLKIEGDNRAYTLTQEKH